MYFYRRKTWKHDYIRSEFNFVNIQFFYKKKRPVFLMPRSMPKKSMPKEKM